MRENLSRSSKACGVAVMVLAWGLPWPAIASDPVPALLLDRLDQPSPEVPINIQISKLNSEDLLSQQHAVDNLASEWQTRSPELQKTLPHSLAQLEVPIPALPDDRVEGGSLRTEPQNSQDGLFKPTQPQLFQTPKARGRSAPAVTIVTPSAYGLPFRAAAVGIGFQSRTRFSQLSDGSVGAGFGLGDPHKFVGLNIGITSFSSVRQGFLQIGTINFKVNRYLPHDLAIAAGLNNGLTWGGTDSSVSPYGVVTKQFKIRPEATLPLSRLYVSAGVGGGQFRSELDVAEGTQSVGPFGSLALRLAEPVNLISEWSGQDLTLGLSIVPFRKYPLVITPAVTDITGNAGDGSRFILGIGYGFKY